MQEQLQRLLTKDLLNKKISEVKASLQSTGTQ